MIVGQVELREHLPNMLCLLQLQSKYSKVHNEAQKMQDEYQFIFLQVVVNHV